MLTYQLLLQYVNSNKHTQLKECMTNNKLSNEIIKDIIFFHDKKLLEKILPYISHKDKLLLLKYAELCCNNINNNKSFIYSLFCNHKNEYIQIKELLKNEIL